MDIAKFVDTELAISRAVHDFLSARGAPAKIRYGSDNAVTLITKEVRQ